MLVTDLLEPMAFRIGRKPCVNVVSGNNFLASLDAKPS